MAYQLMKAQYNPVYSDYQSTHETFELAQTALYAVQRTGGEYGVVDDVLNYTWTTETGWVDADGNPVEV